MNCAAPNADWTVISNCAELTLIPAQSFPVGFSCAEKLYNSAHEKPTGNDCAEIKVNFAYEKPTGNNCAGIKVNSEKLEITVQSAFWAAQFIDFTPVGEVIELLQDVEIFWFYKKKKHFFSPTHISKIQTQIIRRALLK